MRSVQTLSLLAIALASLPAFANHESGAGTVATITFDGTELTKGASLSDLETHTLYETHEVPSTCYREVFDGYRDECHTYYRQECRTVYEDQCSSHPVCHREQVGGVWRDVCNNESSCHQVPRQQCISVPEQECHRVPMSHQEAYSCMKSETVAVGEETDYHVNASVTVNFSQVPAGITPAETIKLSLDGETVSIASAGISGKLLLFVQSSQSVSVTKPDQGASSPGEKLVTATFNVSLVDAKAALGGVNGGIGDLAISGNNLTFTLGRVALPDFLSLSLNLKKSGFFGDKDLFDGELQKGVVTLKDLGEKTQVTVALDRLNLSEPVKSGSKYIIGLNATLKGGAGNGTLLNPETVGGGSKVEKVKVKAQ